MAVKITLTFDDQGKILSAETEKGKEYASEDYKTPDGEIITSGMMCLMKENPCYWCFWMGNRKVCIQIPCPS